MEQLVPRIEATDTVWQGLTGSARLIGEPAKSVRKKTTMNKPYLDIFMFFFL
jgi:hypothetical protein